MDGVDAVIDLLAAAFDPVVYMDLAAKQVSVQSQLSREAIAGLIKEEGYSVV